MFKKIFMLFVLLISFAFSETIISGEISGTLSKANSPYFVEDTVIVSSGNSLTIEPGVTVKFRPDTRERKGAIMIIFGDLKAIGTVDDSIYFTKSEGSGYWQSVLIRENAEDCEFRYCNFSYGSGSIVGSTFSMSSVFCFQSTPVIENCIFEHNAGGLNVHEEFGAIIRNNIFRYNEWSGLSCISTHNSIISNNLSHHNGTGIVFGGMNTVLANCTIVNNTNGLRFHGYSKAPAKNCIIWNNDTNIKDDSPDYYGKAIMTYCDVDGGWQGNGNIELDPLFADPDSHDYHLQALSPCIDSGDPVSPYSNEPEYNGGIVNIGAYGNTSMAATSFPNSPEILISYPILDFGMVTIGKQDSSKMVIRNIGNDSLRIGYLMFENPDILFDCSMRDLIIPPDGSRDLWVYLNAYKEGIYSKKLFIANNDTCESMSFIKINVEITGGLFGNISGVFEKENSPYVIGGDVTVPSNTTLTIEPGTEIRVMENVSILVYGTLYCNGTEDESITITTYEPGKYWGSLYFGSGSGSSEVSYSTIEYGECKNEYVDGFWGPNSYFIACNSSGPSFHHNIIKPVNGAGGLVVYYADTDISDNTVIGGYHAGIRSCGTSSNIVRNFIKNNTCHGMAIDNGGTPHVENNIFINNHNGIYCSDTDFDFVNNTIIGSSHAGMYLWNLDQRQPNVKNCIIWDCATSIMPYGLDEGYLPTVSYSNIQGGWEGEGNIDTIPYFVDLVAGDYCLADSSACIDAGDPDPRYNDADSSRNDMGASGGRNGFYLSTPVIYSGIEDVFIPNDIDLANNYPNPFNPVTTIKFNVYGDICAPAILRIYSSAGKFVKTLSTYVNGTGEYTMIWNSQNSVGVSVPSGVYVYTLTVENTVKNGKMTLLK